MKIYPLDISIVPLLPSESHLIWKALTAWADAHPDDPAILSHFAATAANILKNRIHTTPHGLEVGFPEDWEILGPQRYTDK